MIDFTLLPNHIKEYAIKKSTPYSAPIDLQYVFQLSKLPIYDIEDHNIYSNLDEYKKYMDEIVESIGPILNDDTLDINKIKELNEKYHNDSSVFSLLVKLALSLYGDYKKEDCQKIQQIIYNE